MASKSDKEKKDLKKSAPAASKQTIAKPSAKKAKEEEDEDDDDDEVETPKPAAKKNAKATSAKSKKKGDDNDDDDEDDVAEDEEVDEWDKVEEDEEWDPDFDEFDLPRSRAKKGSTPVGKKAAKGGEEDDLGLDDDYKNLDLFNESSFEEEEDDF